MNGHLKWVITILLTAMVSVMGALFVVERNNSIALEVVLTKVEYNADRLNKLDTDMSDRQRQLDERIMTLVRTLVVPQMQKPFIPQPWLQEQEWNQ